MQTQSYEVNLNSLELGSETEIENIMLVLILFSVGNVNTKIKRRKTRLRNWNCTYKVNLNSLELGSETEIENTMSVLTPHEE